MRAVCLLMLAMSVFPACGGGSDCQGDDCVGSPCGPGGSCPGNLVCDLVTNTCILRGGTADAGPDAAPLVDAPPAKGNLTLTVYVTGVPTAFADVVVGNADGTIVTTGQTNTNGVYQFADFETGMMVSVVDRSAASPLLYVLQDLIPGSIVLGDPALGTARAPITASAVAFNNSPSYEISDGCERPTPGGALKWTLAVSNDCIDAQNQIRVVAYARDAVNGRTAYAVVDSAYPPAGNLAITQWNTDLGSVVFTPSNVPATGTSSFVIYGVRSGTPRASYPSDSISLTGPTVQTVRFAPGAYDVVESAAAHTETSDGFLKGQRLVHARPVSTSTTTNIQEAVDFAADFLPLPTDPALDRSDPPRPFVTFGAPAPTFDATLVYLLGTRGGDPVTNYTIIFVAAPGKTSLKLPELPPSLDVVTPTASDTLRLFATGFIDIDVVPGYRAFLDIPNFAGFVLGNQAPRLPGENTSRLSLMIPALR